MPETDDQNLIHSYLLGQLQGEARDRFEERYLADETLHERLLDAEHQLIDDHIAFEKHYLANPHHQTRVALHRSLQSAAPSRQTLPSRDRQGAVSQPGWHTYLTPALAAALLLAVSALVYQTVRVAPSPRESATLLARATLSPASGARSGESPAAPPIVQVPANTAVLELTLQLDAPSSGAHRAVLLDLAGNEIASAGQLTAPAGATAIAVSFPTARLSPQTYMIRVSGHTGETVQSFAFQLSR